MFFNVIIVPTNSSYYSFYRGNTFAIFLAILFNFQISYLTAIVICLVLAGLLYVSVWAMVSVAQRTSLRIAEAKRGPVLALASILAAIGLVLELGLGG
jgi:hypothetical protein